MLSRTWKKLYPHIYKKPCEKCLVFAKCNNTPFLKEKPCDLKIKWKLRSYKIISFLDNIELGVFIASCFGGFIFLIVTFGFGIWKWVDLFKSYTS